MFDLVDQALGIKRHLGLEVHALGVGVLLEAGVEGHPGVALAVHRAPAGGVVDPGFDPDVFEAEGADLAAGYDGDVGDAALTQEALCGFGGGDAADPVHDLGGGELNGAVDEIKLSLAPFVAREDGLIRWAEHLERQRQVVEHAVRAAVTDSRGNAHPVGRRAFAGA